MTGQRHGGGDAEPARHRAHRRVVGPPAHDRDDREDQNQLAADEQREGDHVQEPDRRPGIHGYRVVASRR
jgi:hypothetical protein